MKWSDSTAARVLAGLTHQPRRRAPRIVVDGELILPLYCDDFHRHAVVDARTVDEALTLAEMDASDRMTMVEARS